MFKFISILLLLIGLFKLSLGSDEWEIIDDYNPQYINLMNAVKWTIRNIQKSTNDLGTERIKGFSMPLTAMMLEDDKDTEFKFILNINLNTKVF
jgi:hypothetical protein